MTGDGGCGPTRPPVPSRTLALALALALALVEAGPARAQEPLETAPAPNLVRFRMEGGPAPEAAELTVVAGGRVREVEEVRPVSGPWRLALLFDRQLGGRRSLRNAALELASRARDLTEAGSVEILLLDREVHQSLPPTRDPLALEQSLEWIALREEGLDRQTALRRAFLEDLAAGETRAADLGERSDKIEPSLSRLTHVAALARQAIGQERALLEERHRALVEWAAGASSAEPSLLVLATGGWDGRPGAFYRGALEGAGFEQLARTLEAPEPRPDGAEVAALLAGTGWWVVSYRSTGAGDRLLAGGLAEPDEDGTPVAPDFDPEPGVETYSTGVDLLDLGRGREAAGEAPPTVLLDPEAPLRELASATAGWVVRDPRGLDPVLVALQGGLEARLATARAAEGDGLTTLSVQAAGRRLAAPTWLAESTPGVVTLVRMLSLLEEVTEEEGPLPVSAALRVGSAEPSGLGSGELLVQLLQEDARAAGRLRATVGIAWGDAEPSVFQRELATAAAPEGVGWVDDEDGDGRTWALPIPLPGGSGSRVAVLVEDPGSGLWGAAYAALVEGAAGAAEDDDSLVLPAPRTVNLLPPQEVLAVGEVTFRTVVSDRRIARLVYWLDGEARAEATAPPFAATLDLGSLPRAQRVEAVAYDAAGKEVGRDALVVNEGAGSLRVRIVEPHGPGLRQVGPVDVEAEIKVPRFTDVERVEFFWNTDLVATRFGPPWRQRIVVSPDAPQGFVRVVARLRDGSAAEDVAFFNSPGAGERVEVNLVELYFVVTDRDGRPVRDLPADAFRVVEEGNEQQVATFSDAGNLPLTVGVAIDSSASMFVKLPKVQRAAAEFVLGSLDDRDRAFVVGFGDEPNLAEDTTSEQGRVVQAIGSLRSEGKTAVWKGIVYSLVQLQGVPGRKALVVYLDGADEDEEFPYRTCLQFARRLGVPVYLIVTNSEIYRTGGRNPASRGLLGRLERLADAVGGRVFLTRVGEDLGAIYQEIAEELRSQYLVAYYPEARGDDVWRRVTVEVDRPGLKVRTISGYFR